MNLKDIARWNVRVSMVYAVGIWTMLGTYGYFQLNNKWKKKDGPEDNEGISAEKEELIDAYVANQEEEKPKGFNVSVQVRYRDNFVPYSTRLFNYLKALNGPSESTTENGGPDK